MTNSQVPRHWDARFLGPVPHNGSNYSKCVLAGVLTCGVTHAAMTPVDVVKCNMQVDPVKYRGTLLLGTTGIFQGFGPTLIGYSLQGMFKYGLYEIFKDTYMNLAAEFADVALCPLEMTKVKIQTSPRGTFPTGFLPALKQMNATRIETRYPFGSLIPLWSRQVPYTMAKFLIFEQSVQLFYTHLLTEPKKSYGKVTQLGVTFRSGYIAGIISYPADSLISRLGKAENKGH
ncbi:mitochondrial carrier protein [Mycena maculata]|uniref:Mitochondrial carrier protein n=1 Tax=Mycena maculata TaxID=230809 RepID=A0AAD7MN11_9AGAR|nr:mitochondrial carrier protein [Mycena maculata]